MYRTLITVDYLVDRPPAPWDCSLVLHRGKGILAQIEEPLGYSRYLAVKRLASTSLFKVQVQYFVATRDPADPNQFQRPPFLDVAIQAEVFPDDRIEDATGYLESGIIDRHRPWSAREKRKARGRRKWTARAGCDRKPRKRRAK